VNKTDIFEQRILFFSFSV